MSEFIKNIVRHHKIIGIVIFPLSYTLTFGLIELSKEVLPRLYRSDIISIAEAPPAPMKALIEAFLSSGFDGIITESPVGYSVPSEAILIASVPASLDIHAEPDFLCGRWREFSALYSRSPLRLEVMKMLRRCGKPLIMPRGDIDLVEVDIKVSREELVGIIDRRLAERGNRDSPER